MTQVQRKQTFYDLLSKKRKSNHSKPHKNNPILLRIHYSTDEETIVLSHSRMTMNSGKVFFLCWMCSEKKRIMPRGWVLCVFPPGTNSLHGKLPLIMLYLWQLSALRDSWTVTHSWPILHSLHQQHPQRVLSWKGVSWITRIQSGDHQFSFVPLSTY